MFRDGKSAGTRWHPVQALSDFPNRTLARNGTYFRDSKVAERREPPGF